MKIQVLWIAAVALFMFTAISPATAEITDKEFAKKLESYLETDDGQKVVGEAVEKHFKQKQLMAKKSKEAKQRADMERQFKNPVKIDAGNSPFKGPADAKVTIIEFSDFECPYCSRGNATMEKVLKEYEGKVRVVFKNLPLPFHANAEPAARAALAAGKQGKFWEMHDAFFANQKKLNEEFYMAKAEELGLNVEQFQEDYNSDELKEQVKNDAALARKHGISGTPGFFVNGVAVKGAYPFAHFKQIIDRWLSEDPSKATG